MAAAAPTYQADFADDHRTVSRLCLSYDDGRERTVFFKPDGSVDLDASNLKPGEYDKMKRTIDVAKAEAMRQGQTITRDNKIIPTVGTVGELSNTWDAHFDPKSDKLSNVTVFDGSNNTFYRAFLNPDGTKQYAKLDQDGRYVDVDIRDVPGSAMNRLNQAEKEARAQGRPNNDRMNYMGAEPVHEQNDISGSFPDNPMPTARLDSHPSYRKHIHHPMGDTNRANPSLDADAGVVQQHRHRPRVAAAAPT